MISKKIVFACVMLAPMMMCASEQDSESQPPKKHGLRDAVEQKFPKAYHEYQEIRQRINSLMTRGFPKTSATVSTSSPVMTSKTPIQENTDVPKKQIDPVLSPNNPAYSMKKPWGAKKSGLLYGVFGVGGAAVISGLFQAAQKLGLAALPREAHVVLALCGFGGGASYGVQRNTQYTDLYQKTGGLNIQGVVVADNPEGLNAHLAYGHDVNQLDRQGKSLLDLANQANAQKIVRELKLKIKKDPKLTSIIKNPEMKMSA